MGYVGQIVSSLSAGLQYTLGLFAITIVLSMPLGLLFMFGRVGKSRIAKGLTSMLVWLLRGTPLLLQLYFFYFGLTFIPVIGKYLVMDRFTAACVAFVLNYAVYFCEIFRGGYLSVDKGQFEAAKVLGFSRSQTIRRIVIPQMLRVCLPSISNESITLVKDTALVTAIGVTEILYFTKATVNRDVNAFAYVVAAAMYLIMTYGLTALFKHLEKKYSF